MKRMLIRRIMIHAIVLLMVTISIPTMMSLADDGYGHSEDGAAPTRAGTDHDPILIDGHTEFTSENGLVSGDGKSSDPFIIKGWRISASSAHGIYIKNVSAFFIIEYCEISGGQESYDGIVFDNVTNGIIRNCSIYVNRNGIRFASENYWGKEDSDNNEIINNSITLNQCGITFDHTGSGYHDNNVISSNNITENNVGIGLIMSDSNWIIYNNIENNTNEGISLKMCRGGGIFNRVYHNNLIGNNGGLGSDQVVEHGGPINFWNETYPMGGNYWSNFDGYDNFSGPNQEQPGADGIGDQPFRFSPASTNYDHYPLMEPIEWTSPPSQIKRPPVIETDPPNRAYVDRSYSVNFIAFDQDTPQANLTWSMDTNATWLHFSNKQELYGTPDETDIGTYWVKVKVFDGDYHGSLTFELKVLSVDHFLWIFAPKNYSCTEDQSFTITCEVMMNSSISSELMKPENGTIIWNISTNASFISIGVGTGIISGTPTNSHVGLHQVTISATDGIVSNSVDLEILVLNVNDPPAPFNERMILISSEDPDEMIIDIEDLFYDEDSEDLIIEGFGTENISVEILDNNSIRIIVKDNWFGTNNITITANDTQYIVAVIIELRLHPHEDRPINQNFTYNKWETDGNNVTFKANPAIDVDSIDLIYEWDFGDGYNGFGININHTYSKSNLSIQYNVTLTIFDGIMRSKSCNQMVLINAISDDIQDDDDDIGDDDTNGKDKEFPIVLVVIIGIDVLLVIIGLVIFFIMKKKQPVEE